MIYFNKILLQLSDRIIYVLGLIITALAPIQHLLLLMFVFVGFDFLTGITKALHIGESIQSKKLRHTVSKLLTYSSLVIVLYMFDLHFAQPLWGVTIFFKAAMFIIASIEVISINENVTIILGVNILKKIKTFIKNFQNNNQ